MSLAEFFQQFPDEDTCRAFIEQQRLGDHPTCPRCGDMNVYRLNKLASMAFKCGGCKRRFSVRTGTPMEESRLPLQKWLLATYILTTAGKGISSVQLAKGTPRSLQGRALSAIYGLIGRLIDRWGRLTSPWGSKWRPAAIVGSIAHRQAA